MNREVGQKIFSIFYCISIFYSMWKGNSTEGEPWNAIYQMMLLSLVIILAFWPKVLLSLLICLCVGLSFWWMELHAVHPWDYVYKAFLIFALTFFPRYWQRWKSEP